MHRAVDGPVMGLRPIPHEGGFAPLNPPPKAEPLESINKVFEEGGDYLPLIRMQRDAPLLKNLNGSKGCALSGGQGGKAPLWGHGGEAPIAAP
jgi:hypothetical protein